MRRNVGIFAHIDAGKTTLTERMLFVCGAVLQPGSVDRGTAHTDNLEVERRRGISVRATGTAVTWRGARINLLDTPGHADFASEIERSFWALDGAVLLLSAVDGVQPQTELLFEAIREMSVPTLLFLNKTDRPQADPAETLRQAKRRLSPRVADVSDAESLMELLAELDERAMRDYVEGNFYPKARLLSALAPYVLRGEAYLAFRGSALKGDGVEALLDGMLNFLPEPAGAADGPLCGVVYASEDDGPPMGRAAHIRLYSGSLVNRMTVSVARASEDAPLAAQAGDGAQERKVTQIRAIRADGRGEDVGALRAGEVGAVFGLGDAAVGQVLGDARLLPRRVAPGSVCAPLLSVCVETEDPAQLPALRKALSALATEDPLLSLSDWGERLRIRVMGEIQIEVLEEQLRTRFGLAARFSTPDIIYRETIARAAEGFVAYTMPKPCWAVMRFLIEPMPPGSGVSFESRAPVIDIAARYQHQVRQALPLALRQGRLGWQVDDVRITLLAGEHHLIHTHPLDFIVATPMGIHDALRRGGSVLLEPILTLRIAAPSECAGRLISDVNAMRGQVLASEAMEGGIHMECEAPAATAQSYPTRLAIVSGGRGSMSMRLKGYRPCDLSLGCVSARRGVDPLDTAKYILAARSALDGGIFDT